MADKEKQQRWIITQRKTFTRWCNLHLMERDLTMTNIEVDMANGVRLWNLLEILSGKPVTFGKLIKVPKMKIQEITNLANCIRWIQARGLKVVGIGAEDIQMGNTKLILGLVWLLILRFQIEEGGGGGTQELLDWCNSVLNPQGISVADFKKSWQDGRAFCGLVNALEPGTIDLAAATPEKAEDNMNQAFDEGEKLFGFARVLDAIDVLEEPDDLSIMCYVSFYRGYLKNNSAFAPLCYAEGPGLTSAVTSKPAEFTVFAVNQAGERSTTGKAPVRCKLVNDKDEEVCKVIVADNKDGTYSCRYTSELPGTFKLHICIRADHIKNSPYSPTVMPGEPSPGHTTASGEGLERGVAGEKAEFVIQAKDVTGGVISEGGTEISGVLKDPAGDIPVTVVDNGDGTYTCSYVPRTSGPIPLEVNMKTNAFGEGPIAGAPFTPLISASVVDPSRSIATGEGTSSASSGEVSFVKVQARDRFDNNLTVGGDKVAATLVFNPPNGPAQTFEVSVNDNNDGTYDLSYTPGKIGTYELTIKIDDTPIKDMPVSVTVLPGRFSPLECTMDGLDLDPEGRRIVTAGVTDRFKVTAKDAFGNQLQEGGLNIEGVLGGTADVPVMAADNGDGSYEITYTPTKAGPYKLEVKIEGQPMGGKNPFPLLVIPAAPCAATSTASGDGITTAKIGENNQFIVHTRDAYENEVTMGGADVAGSLNAEGVEPVAVEAADNGDGSYTCTYPSLTKAGTYQLVPTIAGQPIRDAPFTLVVSPGSASASSTLITLATEHIAGHVGATVQLRDSLENLLGYSAGDVVVAKLLPLSKRPVPVKDNKDGTYDAQYPAGVTGNVELTISANDQLVPGAPWNVNIIPFPQTEQTKAEWSSLLPESGSVLLRLLKQTTPERANQLFAELSKK